MQVMRAENQPDKRIAFINAVRYVLLLHHTAAQRDEYRRVPAFERLERAHIAEHPVLGMFPDGTGIEQDEIRVIRGICKGIAHFTEHPFDFSLSATFCWQPYVLI